MPVVAGGIAIGMVVAGVATVLLLGPPITGYGFDAGAMTAFAGLYWQSHRPATYSGLQPVPTRVRARRAAPRS